MRGGGNHSDFRKWTTTLAAKCLHGFVLGSFGPSGGGEEKVVQMQESILSC